jgi:hypothetical protein
MNTLILGDEDMNCDCKDKTINDLNITMIGLNLSSLDKFDLIVYRGNKGVKILRGI